MTSTPGNTYFIGFEIKFRVVISERLFNSCWKSSNRSVLIFSKVRVKYMIC